MLEVQNHFNQLNQKVLVEEDVDKDRGTDEDIGMDDREVSVPAIKRQGEEETRKVPHMHRNQLGLLQNQKRNCVESKSHRYPTDLYCYGFIISLI